MKPAVRDRLGESLHRKLSKTAGIAERIVICIAMAVSATLILAQVLLRYFFGIGIAWAGELTVYSVIWATFIGASAALNSGHHLNVGIRDIILKGRPLLVVQKAASFIGLIYSIGFFIVSLQLVLSTHQFGQVTPALQIPIWIVYLAMPLSGVLMAFRFLDQLLWGESNKSELRLAV